MRHKHSVTEKLLAKLPWHKHYFFINLNFISGNSTHVRPLFTQN